MNLKWPEDYQERIETILGARYQEDRRIYFLSEDITTSREAKNSIAKIQLIQKGLRQIKAEINSKIKFIKSRQLPKAQNKSSTLFALASLVSDLDTGQKIDGYQNVALSIDMLLDTCERRKIDLEFWISQQRSTTGGESFVRESIPDDVQIFVWNRDGGKCVKCGSQENLEFDHIIPVSKGGSNTARNIQLLCEACNRKKSNSIGG